MLLSIKLNIYKFRNKLFTYEDLYKKSYQQINYPF